MSKVNIIESRQEILNIIIDLDFNLSDGISKQDFINRFNSASPGYKDAILSYFYKSDNIIILLGNETVYMLMSKNIIDLLHYCMRIQSENPSNPVPQQIVGIISNQILNTHLYSLEKMN